MSIKATAWAWEQSPESPISKLVLLALAEAAGDDNVACPGINRLVERTRLTKRTVIDHIALLENAGLISVEWRVEDGQHMRNRYRLNVRA